MLNVRNKGEITCSNLIERLSKSALRHVWLNAQKKYLKVRLKQVQEICIVSKIVHTKQKSISTGVLSRSILIY